MSEHSSLYAEEAIDDSDDEEIYEDKDDGKYQSFSHYNLNVALFVWRYFAVKIY